MKSTHTEKKSGPKSLLEWIEMPPAELSSYLLSGAFSKSQDPIHIYARMRNAFLHGNLFIIESIIQNELTSLSDSKALSMMGKGLISVRTLQCTPQTLSKLMDLLKTPLGPLHLSEEKVWEAEFLFLTCKVAETLRQHPLAIQLYEQAIQKFTEVGAPKRVTECKLSRLACKSRIAERTELNITEYVHLAREAIEIDDFRSAAIAHLNISREYEVIGSLQVALTYAEKAVRYSEKNFGTRDYFLCILNRCHLLLTLGQNGEALLDFEAAQASSFPEIQSAMAYLRSLFEKLGISVSGEKTFEPTEMSPSWRDRVKRGFHFKTPAAYSPQKEYKLADLEQKLVTLLTQAARDRFELIEKLYPSTLNPLSAQDRLKNLIWRVRKKCPGLIQFKQGKYSASQMPIFKSALKTPD